ncbi:MAG: aminoglycoside 3'-phosphotransferase [Phycisphaerales bacterium]|nr:aminoglycoside 3'-phosphotransferase [Phycisphaerales bacterium]
MTGSPWIETPSALRSAYEEFDWVLAHEYEGHSVVHRLERGGVPELFAKTAEVGHYPSLQAEAERLRWAGAYLPVPEVVASGADGPVEWLITSALGGRDATHPDLRRDPSALTRILARGLRRFHDSTPVDDCPFDFRLPAAIGHVRARFAAGLIDAERDFHEEFAHLTPSGAVGLLESTHPQSEDLVVCHGDYCLPNILIEDGRATGYIDLGELGVADRWWDLAVATWSLTWNLGPGHEERFLEEYGAARDDERVRFYRLLYDLAC